MQIFSKSRQKWKRVEPAFASKRKPIKNKSAHIQVTNPLFIVLFKAHRAEPIFSDYANGFEHKSIEK